MDGHALLLILQLLFLEGILSIDNAAVLGAMVAHLPRNDPIPWPSFLQFLRDPVHRILGGQRPAALKVGLAGAYAGRGAMLLLASYVAHNPWLRIAGGLYLVKIAADHFGWPAVASDPHGDPEASVRGAGRGFWSVVAAVDLAFSLDNVVAAIALSRELWVVFLGVGLGIVTMRFAAGIFGVMIEREPMLEPAAYVIVLAIGLQLLAEDVLHVRVGPVLKFVISASIIAGAVAYARVGALRGAGARMRWMRLAFAGVSLAFSLPVRPVAWSLTRLRGGAGRADSAGGGR
jgi:tellurite resistance protein TerC